MGHDCASAWHRRKGQDWSVSTAGTAGQAISMSGHISRRTREQRRVPAARAGKRGQVQLRYKAHQNPPVGFFSAVCEAISAEEKV
jgi:hypothetical protein